MISATKSDLVHKLEKYLSEGSPKTKDQLTPWKLGT